MSWPRSRTASAGSDGDDRSGPTRLARRAASLVLVWLFAAAAGVVIPVLAYLIYRRAARRGSRPC